MPQFDVLAVGELNPDLILSGIQADGPLLGTEQAFTGQQLTLGSSTAIACVLMQRLGLATAMVSRVGDDEHGRFCTDALRHEGIDVAEVRALPGQQTGITISVSYARDRMLLTRYGTMEAMAADAVTPEMLGRARHVHSGSFFIQRKLRSGLAGLFEAARAKGLSTSLDTGWDPDEKWLADDLVATLAHTDVFVPNETEFAHLTEGADIDSGMNKLHRMGVREVMLKRGASGTVYSGPEGRFEHPGFVVQPRDTTGAGDACNAGYIAGRLMGLPIPDRLALANASGALTVAALGGTGGLESLAQAQRLIAEGKIRRG